MKRIESLDYLRGLMAFGMMVYHYSIEAQGHIGAEYFIGKIGVYAVSVFYILSGLSLTVVYKEGMHNRQGVVSFAVKRIFRIFPLFWAATAGAMILAAAKYFYTGGAYPFDVNTIILNVTLLFGFVRPDAYIATGAWSIGNEMVFYAVFPVLVYFGSKGRLFLLFIGFLSLCVYIYFAFGVLDSAQPIEAQWFLYVNPMNQIFLFVSGVIIGFFTRQHNTKPGYYIILLSLVVVFILFPASGDKISIITGMTRMVLSLCCITFVAVLFMSGIAFDNIFGRILSFLGEVSYSLYLIHPIVAVPLIIFAKATHLTVLPVLFIVGIPVTLFISSMSYRFMEKPMMKFGSDYSKKIAARMG